MDHLQVAFGLCLKTNWFTDKQIISQVVLGIWKFVLFWVASKFCSVE